MYSKHKYDVKKFIGLSITVAALFAVIGVASGCGKSSQQKILGKWMFGESNDFFYTFKENGEIITSRAGMPDKKEKYCLIDNDTLEIEMEDGEKIVGKINFADNDNTLTMTQPEGAKQTLKRK